ncbi:MAG: hypothetical protein R3B90_13115 [Planctomycetaceae bacterium]
MRDLPVGGGQQRLHARSHSSAPSAARSAEPLPPADRLEDIDMVDDAESDDASPLAAAFAADAVIAGSG